MSLETHIAGSEDQLIQGLHFGSRNTASYITERRNVSFAPQASSAFKPSGSRLMRFSLADQQGWLDGGTVRLIMRVVNLTEESLTPACDSPASMFRRLRLIASGSAVLEDIEEYGRVHQMFSELLPSERRFNNITESWGGSNAAATLDNPVRADAIPGDSERYVVVQFMSSFLSQGKAIPLSMIPLVLEIELGELDDAFTGAENSWEISRPRLVADVLQLDQALQNSYASHLLSGKSLPMFMHGLYSVKTAVPPGSSLFSFPLARGFTRLSTIYITFWDSTGKWVNRFYSPLDGETNTSVNDAGEWNVTIGSERYPTFNVDSHQEAWYRLRLAQQIHMGNESISIAPARFRTDKHILALNLEKAPGQSAHSGVNTRSGSQVTINMKNLVATTIMHVVLHYDQVINASAAGVEVLD